MTTSKVLEGRRALDYPMRTWNHWRSKPIFRVAVAVAILLVSHSFPARTRATETRNVILVTMDGLRWQELFRGADLRLIETGARDAEATRNRFWSEDEQARRNKLMPFFWTTVAPRGQVFGNPAHGGEAVCTNGRYFSYPGYNELLTGLGDKSIDSNAKRSNTNVTVLEWINRRPEYASRVAAFASWDVFPFIINAARSRVLVNAGWQDIPSAGNSAEADVWNDVAGELPRVWPGVRYDVFTYKAARDHLRHHQPRVLYVALGETDDWAHEGRYDLYLDAAWRNDRYIQHLWETAQSLPEYQGKTSLVLTTDHGRGDGREGWKSHGVEYEGSQRMWIALMGPDTPALGIRENVSVTQSQVAATTAALLGLDFCAQDRRVAAPLPGAVDVGESE